MPGARSLPAVAVVAGGCLLAWVETGSIDASDWLLYAVLAALLLARRRRSRARPSRPPAARSSGWALLVAFAGWQAVSIAWSALPSLARDDALLTLFYAVVLAIGLSVRDAPSTGASWSRPSQPGVASLAVATAIALRFGSTPEGYFGDGRLAFPVTYTNGGGGDVPRRLVARARAGRAARGTGARSGRLGWPRPRRRSPAGC